MIITIKGATFTNNIGTLDSWRISTVLGTGATYNGVSSIKKENGGKFTATVTISKGYTIGSAGISVTMGGVNQTNCWTTKQETDTITITFTINSVNGNVVIKVPTKNTATGDEGSSTTKYTITYKYMYGSTSVKSQTTEQVTAGTTRTFSTTDSRAQVSGYTCSSVSPSGQQTINSNITVTYNYTANAVNPPATGDTGTIRWTNHGYQSGTGLVDRPARAMARMAAVKNDIIRIEGLEGFTMVDLVAFDADGETALGYTGATTGGINLTYVDGVATFQVPATSSFTNCAYVGLVVKYASEVAIDVSTLPTTYSKVLLPVINQKFDSKTFTMVTESSRMALREPVEVKANRTITITNIPETYVNNLSPVDMVFYNADKTYKKYSSTYTMNFSGSNLVITIPSSTEIGTYVNVTMKCTSDPSTTIKTIQFINSTITSA